MEFEYENKIESYARLLDELRAKTGDDTSALVLLQEIGKDQRTEGINGHRNGSGATPKQKALLDKLNIEYDENITKRAASQLIDEAFATQQTAD